jgi:hypothetical protein
MPRHTQPREVAALKGATKHDPQRYKTEPAKSEFPLGEIPEWMGDEAKAVWFELETYAAKGVLTGGDRMVMATLCELFAEFKEDARKMPANRIGQMIGCMGRLGLTPADRQKVGFEKPPAGNPFEGF